MSMGLWLKIWSSLVLDLLFVAGTVNALTENTSLSYGCKCCAWTAPKSFPLTGAESTEQLPPTLFDGLISRTWSCKALWTYFLLKEVFTTVVLKCFVFSVKSVCLNFLSRLSLRKVAANYYSRIKCKPSQFSNVFSLIFLAASVQWWYYFPKSKEGGQKDLKEGGEYFLVVVVLCSYVFVLFFMKVTGEWKRSDKKGDILNHYLSSL